MFQLLNHPFNFTGYNFQTKRNTAFATGIFVMLFLWLFDNEQRQSILAFADNGIIVSVSQLLFLFAFHNLIVKNKIHSTVKLWQYAAGITTGALLCFSLMYLYVTPVYFKTSYSFNTYFHYIKDNLPFVFPFLLFTVAADYIFMLTYRLQSQQTVVSDPEEVISTTEAIAVTDQFVLTGESKQLIFSICKTDLLFIKSADNYIEISYLHEQKPVKKLIRHQLSAVEADRQNNFLYRVHRSYLCNLQNVTDISGGVQNCVLHFNHSAASIPVSRAKAKEVIQLLKQH